MNPCVRAGVAALAMLLPAGFGCSPVSSPGDFAAKSFLGEQPPELSGGTWINSEGTLSLASLRGNVVWLEFSFLH